MEIYFLQARQALTKTFTRLADGMVDVAPYPHAATFTSHTEQVDTLDAFLTILRERASHGHCLLKGKLLKKLDDESRAGSTAPDTPTNFIVIDVDGLANHTPQLVLQKLGLSDVSHIIQYSSSHGILDKPALSCHIFILLDRPIAPSQLKTWLIQQNLTHFIEHVTLTKSRVSLHYPLDITACQNDKLIYIAPPKCYPAEINRIANSEERFTLIQGPQPCFTFPQIVEDLHHKVDKLISSLRMLLGLPPRKSFIIKFDGAQGYLPNPEKAQVTGVKEARGFTYLNLNGGDSWAYWHPESSFEFIYNFKGEPTYKTSELLPQYYEKKRKELLPVLPKDVKYYVFRDPHIDTYYSGWHNETTGEYKFLPTSNKQKLIDYMGQFGLRAPKEIPDWTCTFDPVNSVQIDARKQYWNRFRPTAYMTTVTEPQLVPPPALLRLIQHVISDDPQVIRAFFNWLAFAFRLRRATGTAWILQGVPGTGKGILLNHVIKPLFGLTNYTARRMEELEDKFNGYLENCLIVYIDEVHVGVSKRADMIMANLKNEITEPVITIRAMRQTAYEAPNYLNWIFSSNMTTPIHLPRDDRRFNVGHYQTKTLRSVFPNTTLLVTQLEQELEHLASFLNHLTIDIEAVRFPVESTARQDLIDNSKTSLDVVGDAMLTGDLEMLASFIGAETDVMMQIKADNYKALIHDIARTGRSKLTRDEIRTIFLYTVGDVPLTPAKFSRFLSYRGIKLKKIRVNDRTTTGIEIEWQLTDALRQEILTGLASEPRLKVITNDGLSGVQ